MGSQLSHALLDLGFFSALGTSEHPGGRSEEVYVGRGTPNTWDFENGVYVIYDEVGRPWIRGTESANNIVIPVIQQFNLKQGAYVPHSNDSGRFVRKVMEKLQHSA